MDADHARELLARERARIERTLADVARREDDDDPDPFEASDVASDLLDAELGEGLAERLREELEAIRSEEHTSELQSLSSISYAVFCWIGRASCRERVFSSV